MIVFRNVTELERALTDAQEAHHKHEERMSLLTTDAHWVDPEWALWYATHMDLKYRHVPMSVDEGIIRAALEGDSNDAEHDALVHVANSLGIRYAPKE